MNIVILFGGESGEHEVSCISALSVFNHINRNRFNPILIGITPQGVWHLQEDAQIENNSLVIIQSDESIVSAVPGKGLFCRSVLIDADFVFPVLHGTNGEDGTVQGLLELLHLPYAGSGVTGSAVGMDKVLAKQIWDQCGIPIVPFKELSARILKTKESLEDAMDTIESDFNYPLFVKPVNAGSSVGASKAANREELKLSINNAFQFDCRIIVEICINAREIECAVIGNEEPISFFPGEITSNHEFYDYDAKYNDPEGAILLLRANLDNKRGHEIMKLAEKAYSAVSASGFSRVDFFIDRDNAAVYLNEINTIPGFTHISMFPKMCENSGIAYPDLIERIIELGIKRSKR